MSAILGDQMQMQPNDFQALQQVLQRLDVPFWKHIDFWIATLLGVAGVFVSFLAYRQAEAAKEEARQAKEAATEAGRTVKLQTMSIELTEIAQKLDRVQPGIKFNAAKDLFNETSRRLRRASKTTSPPLTTVLLICWGWWKRNQGSWLPLHSTIS
jgi:hypothetical protein